MIVADYTIEHLGNLDLLQCQPKITFLCSRQVPAEVVLKCYDWAITTRNEGKCVISGFHSPLEKDVLHYLLKGSQPIIMVLARSLKSKWEPRIQKALDEGRMLILSPFSQQTKRASEDTATVRNDLMIKLGDEMVVGYIKSEGILEKQLGNYQFKVI